MLFRTACFLALAALAAAQAPTRELNLTGNRFRPLQWEELNAQQRTMIEHITSGPRGNNLGGPFNILLRSPEVGDLAQELGSKLRFMDTMPAKLRELAIIITSRHWISHYEWQAHRRAAAQAGLDESIIQAIAAGRRPEKMSPEETVIYNFATELLNTRRVSDATFAAAKQQLGERGVVDLIALMGYYQMVAMLLNVDEYPLPAGTQPELKPLP
jgi:4-carboxymuconolactone decarboxylase